MQRLAIILLAMSMRALIGKTKLKLPSMAWPTDGLQVRVPTAPTTSQILPIQLLWLRYIFRSSIVLRAVACDGFQGSLLSPKTIWVRFSLSIVHPPWLTWSSIKAGDCNRGGFCNFLHRKRPTDQLVSELHAQQRIQRRVFPTERDVERAKELGLPPPGAATTNGHGFDDGHVDDRHRGGGDDFDDRRRRRHDY